MRDDFAQNSAMTLAQGWKMESDRWAQWARTPGHDSYWRFHRDQFLPFLPAPGEVTVDIGCGEGRLSRDLKNAGHNVVGIDISERLIELARAEDPKGQYILADAAKLPLADAQAELAIAFMTPQDIDDLDGAVSEIWRILKDQGKLCIAIVHPLNSAGQFASSEADSAFVISESYLDSRQYSDSFERDGLQMTFHSRHRTLEQYSRSLEKAGFLIEAIRENPVPESACNTDATRRWRRIPLFMHIRAVKLLRR